MKRYSKFENVYKGNNNKIKQKKKLHKTVESVLEFVIN